MSLLTILARAPVAANAAEEVALEGASAAGGGRPRYGLDWRVLAIVLAFSTLPAMGGFLAPFGTLDEAYLLVYPEQLRLGRIPHEDFFTVYGPGGYAALAAVFWLTGPSVIGERALGMFYHFAVAAGLAHMTRPYGRVASCASGAASAVLMLPVGLGAYAWFGGLALAVWSLALLTTPQGRAGAVLAGLFGGLVMAWRLEMIVLLLAAWPMLRGRRLARPYLLGWAVGLAPMAVYLVFTGPAVFENVFLSRMALNAQLRLASVPAVVWLAVVLLLTFTALLVVMAVRGPRDAHLMSWATLAVLLLPQSLQRLDLEHVVYAICVTPPLVLATLLRTTGVQQRRRVRKGWSPPRISTAGLLLLGMLTASSFLELAQSPVVPSTINGRTTLLHRDDEAAVRARVELITRHVPAGSSIFVGATDMSVPTLTHFELYHLLPQYEKEAYYLELPPGVAERAGSPLVDDIARSDWLILSHMSARLREALFPYMGGSGATDANEVVSKHFCVVDTIPEVITLYRKCVSEKPRSPM